jgi:D-hexose-6-phosphate mutarotase
LDGAVFLDNREGNREKIQRGDVVLSRQTDNAYADSIGLAEIIDPLLGRTLKTEKLGSNSTIVWNPWSDGASSMADLSEHEWRQMLCVEGGNILTSAVSLDPGQSHSMAIAICLAWE